MYEKLTSKLHLNLKLAKKIRRESSVASLTGKLQDDSEIEHLHELTEDI